MAETWNKKEREKKKKQSLFRPVMPCNIQVQKKKKKMYD